MTRRNALIGFTEAELGFVVAAVVAFTAAAEMPDKLRRDRGAGAAKARIGVETVHVERASAPAPIAEKARPKWASDVLRRGCSEVEGKQLHRVPVEVIDVDGANRYRVGGKLLSLTQLDELLAPYEAEARDNACRYTLQFRPGSRIGARDLLEAEEPFQGRFYREHRLR
jgi:hypothetical protein